jgi:ABC-2 type transport system ATP-binding protein
VVAQFGLIRTIRLAADQDEPPIAIATVDVTGFRHLQPHPRMPERSPTRDLGRAVASDTGLGDANGFGRRLHERAIASSFTSFNPPHFRFRRIRLRLARAGVFPGSMTAAIAISNLSKTYAGGKQALRDVTFDVPQGSIFGLLGPNGAGKSTLINILAGLVNKTGGTASIWGFDIDAHPRNAKASIGIVNQEILFDPFFTPLETLEIQAGLYGVPRRERRSLELLRAVHLEDKANAYARTLSGGMKRRLMVAKAMVHAPPVLVLDEPTAGVDIELRQQLWNYVRELNAAGVTVVLTTHYLEEAETLCDRIAIINNGRLIANEPTRELVGKAQEKVVAVTVDRDVGVVPDNVCFQKIVLRGARTLEITYAKDRVNAGEVLAAVQGSGFGIVDVSTREPDLEDVFLSLTRAANL